MITPGQAHDVTAFPALMQEIDCDPEQMLGDKGYDSEAVRNNIEERGGEAAIPSTATRKIQHAVDKALYALRNRIERFFNRAKNSRRVATRYDKLIESFAAFVLLACIRIWIKFVHTTYAGGDTGEVVICGSRLWQQGPSEDISAGEWQLRGMMWRSLRAAPMAMLFAGMASRLRARSATFTSRMST